MSRLLFATLFSLLLFVGLQVSVDAEGGSAEEKTRRETSNCMTKEPTSAEKSDSNEDVCAAFEPLPTSSTAAPSTVAPSSSSAAPSSSSAAPSSSSAAPSSSSLAPSSVSPSPGNFTSRCRLKHAMVSISLTLTITEKADFDKLLLEVENEVLANHCGCLDDDDKIVKAGHKIKHHLSKHKSVKDKIHYKKIGKWGGWRDMVQVGVDIQGEKTDEVLLLDVNDNCPLIEALRNGTQGNVTLSVDIEILISKIKTVLKYPWTKTQKRAKIHKHMHDLCKAHPEYEKGINEIEIEGFGSVESFRRVFKVAHQTTRLLVVINGTSDADCELLKKLQVAANNVSINVTERVQIQQLHDVILGNFSLTLDIPTRLQIVSEQVWQCIKLSPWTEQLIMDIELVDNDEDCGCKDNKWGDIYELSYVSHFCTNDGSCADSADGEGVVPTGAPSTGSTAVPSSSSAAPSSSSAAPSSSSAAPSSSSAAPSSSSANPSACGNRELVIVPNGCTYGNSSWLEYSIQVVYCTWSRQEQAGYNSVYTTVRNAISSNAAGYTLPQRVNDITIAFHNYSKNNPVVRSHQMNIVVQGGLYLGNIQNWCDCGLN